MDECETREGDTHDAKQREPRDMGGRRAAVRPVDRGNAVLYALLVLWLLGYVAWAAADGPDGSARALLLAGICALWLAALARWLKSL